MRAREAFRWQCCYCNYTRLPWQYWLSQFLLGLDIADPSGPPSTNAFQRPSCNNSLFFIYCTLKSMRYVKMYRLHGSFQLLYDTLQIPQKAFSHFQSRYCKQNESMKHSSFSLFFINREFSCITWSLTRAIGNTISSTEMYVCQHEDSKCM